MFAESPCLLNKPLQLNHPPGGGAINPAFGIGLRREYAEDLFLAHDQVFLALELDLLPRVLAEEDLVAGLHVERGDLAVLVGLALADRDHFTLLRLFLGAVGDDDRAHLLLALFDALDDDAVRQRPDSNCGLCCHRTVTPEKLWGRAVVTTRADARDRTATLAIELVTGGPGRPRGLALN